MPEAIQAGALTYRSWPDSLPDFMPVDLRGKTRRECQSERQQAPPELDGRAALVVDDEPDARELAPSILEDAGVKVQTAASVDEALAKIANAKPDVIVCDISMPARDGYDFIRSLRELPRDQGGRIPAVALTAHARAEDRRKALAFGFQNHAAKPIEPQELLLVVANLVGRYA